MKVLHDFRRPLPAAWLRARPGVLRSAARLAESGGGLAALAFRRVMATVGAGLGRQIDHRFSVVQVYQAVAARDDLADAGLYDYGIPVERVLEQCLRHTPVHEL